MSRLSAAERRWQRENCRVCQSTIFSGPRQCECGLDDDRLTPGQWRFRMRRELRMQDIPLDAGWSAQD